MQRILLLDNYDSFTFNLSHYLTGLGADVHVVRNDQFDGDLKAFDKIVLSPGPGLPNEAGKLMEVIESAAGKIPTLGVCLGMQGIGIHLGGELYNQTTVKHGLQEEVLLEESQLFNGLSSQIKVGLYHSWALSRDSGNFTKIAQTENGTLMGIENREKKLYGVQFHPESILTPDGMKILENFMSVV